MANRVIRDNGRSVPAIPLLVAAALTGAVVGWRVPGPVRLVATPAPPAAVVAPRPPPPLAASVLATSIAPRVAPRPESAVCGSDAEASGDVPTLPPALRARALVLLDARMLANPDPAIQAAGLLIGARTRPDEARSRVERLARLATATHDARIVAIAAEGCRDARDDWASACHLLEPAQWAQLDADNAVPWLTLAEISRARGDAAAEDDAMYHAARARHSDLRPVLLPALVEQALADAPRHALLRTLALATSGDVQAGWSFASTTEAMHYCMADDRVLIDPDRARTCDLLAGVLAEPGASAIELGTAQAIGVRLAWPAQRLEALESQATASADAARRRNVAMDMSCSGVDAAEASLQAALREMAAEAGR